MPANRRMVVTSIRAISIAGSLSEYLLHQVDPQHGGQRMGWAAAFAAGPGVMGLDQSDQGLPWHHRLHLHQDLLALDVLPGSGLLINRKP